MNPDELTAEVGRRLQEDPTLVDKIKEMSYMEWLRLVLGDPRTVWERMSPNATAYFLISLWDEYMKMQQTLWTLERKDLIKQIRDALDDVFEGAWTDPVGRSSICAFLNECWLRGMALKFAHHVSLWGPL